VAAVKRAAFTRSRKVTVVFLVSGESCNRREPCGFRGIRAVVNGDRRRELRFICRA